MAKIIKRKNPRKPWTVRYRQDGRQREKSFVTSREANDFRAKFEYDSRQQLFIDPKLANEPFAVAAGRWIDQHQGTPRTAQLYRWVLANHVEPALGSRTLAQVARDRDAVQALASRLGASMARTAYALITATVNDAIRAGRLGSSRLSGIALPVKTMRAEIIFPSHDQLAKLVETMPEEYRLTIWLMRGCGLRIGEALAVRAEDFDGTRLRVHQQLLAEGGLGPLKHRKARDHRDVPVPAYVAELVVGREPGYLFEPLPRRNYHRRFASARKAGGLPAEFTPHTLRHIFASISLANGVPITDVSKWLGHRNINTTYAIYGHLVPSSWDAARAVLDREYNEWSADHSAQVA